LGYALENINWNVLKLTRGYGKQIIINFSMCDMNLDTFEEEFALNYHKPPRVSDVVTECSISYKNETFFTKGVSGYLHP
jgi:hypothetical protein